MTSNAFEALCQQLGYSPEDVLSIRVNAKQVVAVVKSDPGELRVVNYEQRADSLRLISYGTPIGPGTRAIASGANGWR